MKTVLKITHPTGGGVTICGGSAKVPEGGTVTLNGIVYTFKYKPVKVGEVLIGSCGRTLKALRAEIYKLQPYFKTQYADQAEIARDIRRLEKKLDRMVTK